MIRDGQYAIILLVVLILSLTIYIILTLVNFQFESVECADLREVRAMYFSGYVKKKYYDRNNHGNRILEISDEDGFIKLDLQLEVGGVFDFIHEGDSISKERDSDELIIYRNDLIFYKFFEYDCYQ